MSDGIESWGLEPTHPDWAGGLREMWTPGEISAQAQLNTFLEDSAAGYATGRDRPDWREGEKRFWDTLVDADPGSNPANWQWVAGCGAGCRNSHTCRTAGFTSHGVRRHLNLQTRA